MSTNSYPQTFINAAMTASQFYPKLGRGVTLVFYPVDQPNKSAHIYLTRNNITDNHVPNFINFSAEARNYLLSQIAIYNPCQNFILVHLLPNGYHEVITIPFADTGIFPP